MNLTEKLLACAALALGLALHSNVEAETVSSLKNETAVTGGERLSDAPCFDRFLQDLQRCRSNLLRWAKILRPRLVELQYSKEEIGQIRKALQEDQITAIQASVFCDRWFQKHQEKLDPRGLQAFFTGRSAREHE